VAEEIRILKDDHNDIFVFPSILPKENSAVSNYAFGELFACEPMDDINEMAHPLVNQATGVILIKSPLNEPVEVKGTPRFAHEEAVPINLRRVFRRFLDIVGATPTRSKVVKVAFNAGDSAEDAALNQFRSGSETTVASPLRSDLDNPIGLPPNSQTLVCFIQIVCHRFLAISIFARFHCINQVTRVLEVGCGNYDGVHLLSCQQIFVGDELEWLTTIPLFDEIRCSFQIPPPNIANGDNFRV
jgi:hypothetical protein